MTESFPSAVRGGWQPGARFLFGLVRRTLVESLYLLTAPVTAAAGLVLVLGGLCAATAGMLLPGRSPVPPGALAPARWFADLERRRIATVRPPAAGAEGAGQRPRPNQAPVASDPGLWLDVAHAVVALPVALVTSVVTALWWFIGLGAATAALRYQYSSSGPLRPETLSAGSAQSHIDVSLGLTSPDGRVAFGTAAGLLLLSALSTATPAGARSGCATVREPCGSG